MGKSGPAEAELGGGALLPKAGQGGHLYSAGANAGKLEEHGCHAVAHLGGYGVHETSLQLGGGVAAGIERVEGILVAQASLGYAVLELLTGFGDLALAVERAAGPVYIAAGLVGSGLALASFLADGCYQLGDVFSDRALALRLVLAERGVIRVTHDLAGREADEAVRDSDQAVGQFRKIVYAVRGAAVVGDFTGRGAAAVGGQYVGECVSGCLVSALVLGSTQRSADLGSGLAQLALDVGLYGVVAVNAGTDLALELALVTSSHGLPRTGLVLGRCLEDRAAALGLVLGHGRIGL